MSVGDLLVRLLGNNDQLKRTFEDSKEDARGFGREVEEAGQQAQTAIDSISFLGLKAQFETLVAGLKGTYGDFFGSFTESEDIEIGLAAAIRAGGHAVDAVMPIYKEYAAQMMELTRLDDEQVLSILKRAETFGLSGASAIKAANDAIGLAEAADTSAEAMIRLTAKMAEGDIKGAMMFARMVPQLRGVKDELEFVTKYQTLVNAGMEEAATLGSSTAGVVDELADSWGNIKEEMGALVAEAVLPLFKGMQTLVDEFNELSPSTRNIVQSIALITLGIGSLTLAIGLLRAACTLLMTTNPWLLALMTGATVITISAVWLLEHPPQWFIDVMDFATDGQFSRNREERANLPAPGQGVLAQVAQMEAEERDKAEQGGIKAKISDFQPTPFRSNITEEERQFLRLQAGRNQDPQEQMADDMNELVEIEDEQLQVSRRMEENFANLQVASFT